MAQNSYTFTTHEHPSASYGGDKYAVLAGGVMKRKFDRTAIPQNWEKMWIGVRWAVNPIYKPPVSDTVSVECKKLSRAHGSFFLGLNHSSGSSPNEFGYTSHSLGFTVQTTWNTFRQGSTGSYYVESLNSHHWVDNKETASSGTTSIPQIIYEPGQRRFSIFELVRSPASYNTTMSLRPSRFDNILYTEDATGSARLAETMKNIVSLSHNNAVEQKLSSIFQSYESTTGWSQRVKEQDWGIFDQLVITWSNPYSPMYISDVAVITTGSF